MDGKFEVNGDERWCGRYSQRNLDLDLSDTRKEGGTEIGTRKKN